VTGDVTSDMISGTTRARDPEASTVECVVETIEEDRWVELLTTAGPQRTEAIRRLHGLLLRAARHQISRMPSAMLGKSRIDEIVNQAADEALVALLGKLHTFEGRSRFTTWAYKFAIYHAAVEMRRYVWLDREVSLQDHVEFVAQTPSPSDYSEASALAAALTDAIRDVLTTHQRRVVIALLIDDVPIDVLAERLGTSRNALYKTLHDARRVLRVALRQRGFLEPDAVETTGGSR
jgi:RNA polymerase sigma-70 factor (ECF subfamily)